MYPVGSIYVNSTNTNPSILFGGTWQLVYKQFEEISRSYSPTSNTNVNMFTPTSNLSNYNISVSRVGNIIRLRITLNVAVALSEDTVEFGTLNLNNLGASNIGYTVTQTACTSDTGNGIAYVSIAADSGSIKSYDVITKASNGTIPSGSSLHCDAVFVVKQSNMLDDAVSEFHFQRTA